MPGNLAYNAYHLIWVGLDLLFPPNCGGCGSKGTRWCNNCSSKSQVIGNLCCEICGDVTVLTGVCARCQELRPLCSQIRSWAVYKGPIRNMVHNLKYKGNIGLGEALAKSLVADLQRIGWTYDMVIPVPLSLARMEERGYNQAALIARPIAIASHISYQPKVLLKARETRSQVGLTYTERQNNLVDAFAVKADMVSGKNILLVDDVATSGTTFNECARMLRLAGAENVYGYSLARATHNRSAPHTEVAVDKI